MNTINPVINDAMLAWPQWDHNGFNFRQTCLQQMATKLVFDEPSIKAVFEYHLQAACQNQAPQVMPGPTGETNELYLAARGVALIYVESDNLTLSAQQGVVAQIAAALIAGNTLVVCCEDLTFNQVLLNAAQDCIPAHLLNFVAKDKLMDVAVAQVSCCGYVGSKHGAIELNRALVKKEGAIVVGNFEVLDANSDSEALKLALDPNLYLGFVTERTRTINVTAIGGNATLLELGADH
ncbi:MAG: 1-pyrroline-5-carboxylate dehydrogenase [Vibrio sp.]